MLTKVAELNFRVTQVIILKYWQIPKMKVMFIVYALLKTMMVYMLLRMKAM